MSTHRQFLPTLALAGALASCSTADVAVGPQAAETGANDDEIGKLANSGHVDVVTVDTQRDLRDVIAEDISANARSAADFAEWSAGGDTDAAMGNDGAEATPTDIGQTQAVDQLADLATTAPLPDSAPEVIVDSLDDKPELLGKTDVQLAIDVAMPPDAATAVTLPMMASPCFPEPCGTDSDCDDISPCSIDECTGGHCSHTPLANGAACNGGICANGLCALHAHAVSEGARHTCALGADGNIWCWGRNLRGSLGTGDRRSHGMAVPVVGGKGAVRVRAGFDSTCAIWPDGSLKCWGMGLGESSIYYADQDALVPKSISLPFPVTDITQNSWRFCALGTDQVLRCKGQKLPNGSSSQFQQIQTGVIATTDDGNWATLRADGVWWTADPALPVLSLIGGTAGAVEFVCSNHCGCARFANGTVKCWPELLADLATDVTDAVALGASEKSGNYPFIVRKNGFAVSKKGSFPVPPQTTAMHGDCAELADGTLACGQPSVSLGPPTPRKVASLSQVTTVSLAPRAGCYLRDGDARCWGAVWSVGLNACPSAPHQIVSSVPFDAIDASAHAACALSKGDTWCWGAWFISGDYSGAFDNAHAIPIPGKATSVTVRQSAAALLTDGQVFGWGAWPPDFDYQIKLKPFQLLSGAAQIEAAASRTCALLSGKSGVACWQWGDEPAGLPVTVTGVDGESGVAVAENQTCQRTATGAVKCFGGKFNLETDVNIEFFANKVIDNLPPVVQLVAGEFHMCARTAAGAVWCWGVATSGEVGSLAAAGLGVQESPVKVFEGAFDLVAGGYGTCALDTSKSWWCWGDIGLEPRPFPSMLSGGYWPALASPD